MKDKYIGLPVYKAFKDFLTLLRNNNDTNYITLFRFYCALYASGIGLNKEVLVTRKLKFYLRTPSWNCIL